MPSLDLPCCLSSTARGGCSPQRVPCLSHFIWHPHCFRRFGSCPSAHGYCTHVEKARRVYGSGSFMEILAFRIDEVRYILPLHVQALPRTFGLFLLGSLAWQSGFLRKPPALKPPPSRFALRSRPAPG